jgi:hypothetical protein
MSVGTAPVGNRLQRRFLLGLAPFFQGGRLRSVTPSFDGQLGLSVDGPLSFRVCRVGSPHVARAQPRRLPRPPMPRALQLRLSQLRQ